MFNLSFNAFFSEAFFGIIIYEKKGDKFVIKDINPKAETISKVKKSDIIGKPVKEVFPMVEAYGVYEKLEEVHRDGMTRTLPLKRYEDDVLSHWSENIIFKLPNENIVAFYNDYTDAKNVEDNLRRSEEEKRIILDSLPDTVSLKDPDFRYIWVNKALQDQFGVPLKEILGKKCYELAWSLESPCDFCKVEEAIREKKPKTSVNKFVDGTTRETIVVPYFVGEQLIGTLEIGRDITERERLRESLEKTLENYQILTNGSMDAIVVNNEDKFVFANQKAVELFGYEKIDDMLGQTFIQHFPAEEQQKINKNTHEKIQGEELLNRYDTQILKQDGSRLDVEFHLNRIDFDDKPVIVNVIRDIQDRKQMEGHIEYLYQVLLAIRNVNQLIVTEKDIDKLLQKATELLVESKGYLGSWIALVNEFNIVKSQYETNYPPQFDLIGEKIETSDYKCLNKSLTTKVEVFSSDSSSCKLCPFRISDEIDHDILSVPLIHEEKMYGIFTAAVPKGMTGDEERELFIEVAQDISYALYNLDLDEDRNRYLTRLEALHDYASELGKQDSLYTIAKLTVETLDKVVGFNHCSFVVVDNDEFSHVLINGVEEPQNYIVDMESPSVLLRAYKTGETQLIPDVRLDPDFIIGPVEGLYTPLSELCVPLVSNESVIGFINIESEELDAFSNHDQQLVETISNHVATALERLLQEREMELLARFPEENTNPMLRVDKHGILIYANPASDSFLAFQKIGRGDYIPESMWMLISETLRTGMQSEIEVPVNQRHLAIAIIPVQEKGYVNLYCRDITDQKKADQRLNVLYKHTVELVKTRTIDEVAETCLKIIRESLGYEYSSFQLIEGDELVTINYFSSEFPMGGNSETYMRLKLDGPGVTVKVAREGRVQLINDLRETPYFIQGSAGVSMSELAVPILSEKEVMGVLNIESVELDKFSDQDRVMLEIIAQHAGSALSRIKFSEKEDALRNAAEAAQEMDRLKTEFMNTATHEIRTPITSIKGYTELIQEAFNQDDITKASQYFEVVSRNVSRLELLSNDLLDMQRLESGRINLNNRMCSNQELLKELESELSPVIEISNHNLVIETAEKIYYLCDKPRLLQVLVNLVYNAAKYSPEGSDITLCVNEDKDSILFSVEDKGIGISEEDMGKLFSPFPDIHVKDIRHGSGLGLSICKGIVEMHGGKIWAESNGPGKGSKFSFTIPKNIDPPR